MQILTSVGGGNVQGLPLSKPPSNNIDGVTVINPTDYVFFLRDSAGQNVLTVGRGKAVSLPIFGDDNLTLYSSANPVQAGNNNSVCIAVVSESSVAFGVVNLL